MAIWKRNLSIEEMNQSCLNTAISHLGIKITEQGEDWLKATMPIDHRTVQPMGLLHGGISAALAETLGSIAGFCCTEENQLIVGAEINASHLKSVSSGYVTATAHPLRLGNKLQVWQIDIRDQQGRLCCSARHTVYVLEQRN